MMFEELQRTSSGENSSSNSYVEKKSNLCTRVTFIKVKSLNTFSYVCSFIYVEADS